MLQALLSDSNENCIRVTEELLKKLQVKISATTLTKDLEYHPDYPSLLSISDILHSYSIANLTVKEDRKLSSEYPVPCIVSVKGKKSQKDLFGIVSAIGTDTVTFFDPESYKWVELPMADFHAIWSSHIMMVDASEAHIENDYEQKVKQEKQKRAGKLAGYLAVPALALIACLFVVVREGAAAFLPAFFTLITTGGFLVGALLILYELDQYNPIVQQICSAGRKISCNAVLSSDASKILGISWSVIGFTYFTGMLLVLMSGGIVSPINLAVLSLLNLLALPYTIFSVYYQWKVVRQWCVLCLSVQAMLVGQFVTALVAGWHKEIFSVIPHLALDQVFTYLLAFVVPFIFGILIIPAFKDKKESRYSKRRFQKLKHRPEVFNSLLSRQKQIVQHTDGLGIFLGNPQAKYKILKVCNPYCGYCSKAHPAMEELLSNNPDVSVQIIFMTNDRENDINNKVVRHFLYISENENEQGLKNALDEWYMPEKKNYEAFISKYPARNDLREQNVRIKAMNQWCINTGVESTPTFFLNGNQLPSAYTVEDLKYFLSV
jgi:uncharacterized membrane protein/thiol-disulfide isomerase/thioredoxin